MKITRSKIILSVLFILIVKSSISDENDKLINYVNPFIGTKEMGHCYPGATVPFGMVQLSPDTDTILYSNDGKTYNKEVYRYCAGYQYDDPTIVGFSHTHFHGTGHSDLGDFLIMPTVGKVKLNPGIASKPETGYRSRFSHDNEKASPGYYQVKLKDYGVNAELTATSRVGFHKYTFPETNQANIILDMVHGIYNYDGKVIWASVRVENDTLITGYRQTQGWARTRIVYFAMSFSKPIGSYGFENEEQLVYKGFWRKWDQTKNFPEMAGRKLKAYFSFQTKHDEEVKIKFALSGVSTAGALKNLYQEIPHWNFTKTKAQARELWEKELSKIKIEADYNRKVNFYTALYHSFLSPIEYSDVDGKYRGLDQNIYTSANYTNYTIFSLWDTYRALHPLFTLLQQNRTNGMITSMLNHYDQSVHKILPIWSHYAQDNWCMIGYHAVPVIVDAYMKGIRNFNIEKAYEAIINSSQYKPYDGIDSYMKYGYVTCENNSSSVSKTLEYAYDDYTIYQMAKEFGKKDDAIYYKKRALNYKNHFDNKTGFLRAKQTDGKWKTPFDPMNTHGQGYIEGNAWNYSLYVPHDVKGFANLLGGGEKLINYIDTLFIMEISDEDISGSEDVEKVGIIGNYVHGNEPSHHIPYMYNYVGAPWKTQEKVHLIVNSMYHNKPDGLCGNDDCGQMSAWYIFSCMGFYPVCPGSSEYIIGSPCVNEAQISFESGSSLKIIANNLSKENIYIQSVTFNGKDWDKSYFTHNEIVHGGIIEFYMGNEPNKKWGTSPDNFPSSLSYEIN